MSRWSALRVAVGSLNPVKVKAVEEAFKAVFGVIEVIGVKVDSGVPSQPIGEEVKRGAINRARRAISKVPGSKYGVGIEGGLIELWGKYYNFGFVAIVDEEGFVGTGTSGLFECPPSIVGSLLKREELGSVIDRLVGDKDVKMREGAIGVFTKRIVQRKDLYVHGVLMALVPLLNRELFNSK